MTAIQWLLNQPSAGSRRKRLLDEALRAERDGWA